jgi:hypothetical protein
MEKHPFPVKPYLFPAKPHLFPILQNREYVPFPAVPGRSHREWPIFLTLLKSLLLIFFNALCPFPEIRHSRPNNGSQVIEVKRIPGFPAFLPLIGGYIYLKNIYPHAYGFPAADKFQKSAPHPKITPLPAVCPNSNRPASPEGSGALVADSLPPGGGCSFPSPGTCLVGGGLI